MFQFHECKKCAMCEVDTNLTRTWGYSFCEKHFAEINKYLGDEERKNRIVGRKVHVCGDGQEVIHKPSLPILILVQNFIKQKTGKVNHGIVSR